MIRLLKHFVGILFGAFLLFLMVKVRLFEVPHIQTILTVLIFISIVLLFFVLYKRSSSQRKRGMFCLCFCVSLLFHSNAFAGIGDYIDHAGYYISQSLGITSSDCSPINFCDSAKKYDRHTFKSRRKNWKDDQSCEKFFGGVFSNETVRRCARERLNELKTAPSVFVRQDKLTSQQRKNYIPFTRDSHWKTWVNENFSDITNLSEREEMACASFLVSLCSAYEDRHPPDKAMTVKDIMEKDVKKSGCWPCEMSYIILTVIQSLSAKLSEDMRRAGVDLLKILMFLWILYASFQAVVFPSKGIEFIKNLLIRFLCVIVVAVILAGANNLQSFYKNCVTPFISFGLGMTEAIDQNIKKNVSSSFSETLYNRLGIPISTANYCSPSLTVSLTGANASTQLMRIVDPYLTVQYSGLRLTENNTVITPELQGELLCLTQRMYRQFAPVTAIGQSLISFSFENGTNRWLFTWPDFEYLMIGVTLVVLFSVFSFLVAFKIIDIFLRLGFVLVLMPLFVAAAAFPKTRSFTKKGFVFFINIITEFFGIAFAINFILVIFETGVVSNKNQLITAMMAPYSKNYGNNLLVAVTSNRSCYCFFLLLGLFFIGNQLLKISTQVINSIFDAKAVGGKAMSDAALGAVQQVGKYTKKTLDVSGKLAKKVPEYKKPDSSNSSPAASRRYFGQRFGNGIDSASKTTASLIDKVGVGTGKAFSNTGIGAIVGVPLIAASKTLSVGVRAAGTIASKTVKASGKMVSAGAKKIRSFFRRDSEGES